MNSAQARNILNEIGLETSAFKENSPELLQAILISNAIGTNAPLVGGAIDLFVGDTNISNSGELALNSLLALTAPGLGTLAGLGLGSINRGAAAIEEIRGKAGGQAKDIKDELKRITKEEGADAAKKYYADIKNSSIDKEIQQLRASRGGRRLAGAALGTAVGSGLAMRAMVDDSYDGSPIKVSRDGSNPLNV